MTSEFQRKMPILLITLGDVAGIGPEIVVRAWAALCENAQPVVVGDPDWLRAGSQLVSRQLEIVPVTSVSGIRATPALCPCICASQAQLKQVIRGTVSAAAGQAAYDFLVDAIARTMRGEADAIVTAPLHKEGLHAAGINEPGHTEILAEHTKTKSFAMVLYGDGIAVAHVTLHMALRDVFQHLTIAAILEKIRLLQTLLPKLDKPNPRIGVAALNPHAGDGGLFGTEEADIIAPAVRLAQNEGILASGPWPADTLFVHAAQGAYDGIVAMYHDQGHIAMKLRSGRRCVNISAGLPIIRTSVAHGTAYDIAGKNLADESSLIAAAQVAAQLVRARSL